MSLPCAVLHLCDDCEGGGSSEEEEAGGKCKPEQCLALLKFTLLMNLLNNFFYMHNTCKHNVQNILNLELVLFHLKCKISTKLLSVTDFCPENVICKHKQ
jgi:hypothetical protein